MCPNPVLASMNHAQRVRFLYKAILQLHRALPPELAELGNKYVREEFRKHKNAKPEFIRSFMVEWSRYATELAEQVKDLPRMTSGKDKDKPLNIGKALDEADLNRFSEAQMKQLFELAKEIHDPSNHSSETEGKRDPTSI
ncbi:unnamed protein product [Calicophoron daubneyi]|uniref:Succinate dehydrogenase assembly factor 3 n=1 Tax=Calicophoron daubneyi TaxID=300641 RepID=A0AAV2T8Y4_CALDB